MEQAKQSTPREKRKCESPLAFSPWLRETPVRRNDVNLKRLMFSVLPSHITPQSKLRKLVAKNPFESDLINRLHQPAISPTVFAKVPSPAQRSPGFTWSIEELARIKPVTIEEFPMQQVCSPDPELETRAQAAIDRFFKQNQIIPSPWDTRQKENKLLLPFDTPNRLLNNLNSSQRLVNSTKDAWSQTVLSLPPNLPQNVEEVLKPFFTFTQDQNADSDDVNLSNSSLRRKLFSCHDEGNDNDRESFMSLSPVRTNESLVLSCSPPQSGMFVHGMPLKMLKTRWRSHESSIAISPNVSPIHNTENDRLYEKNEHCSHLATQLNFTIDKSDTDYLAERKNLIDSIKGYNSLDESNIYRESKNDVKRVEDNSKLIIINNDKTNACDSSNMKELAKCINSTDSVQPKAITYIFSDKEYSDEISFKITPETASFSHESHKQSNIMSSAFEQRSISNSVQDTGYQTYSMNSIMHSMDNYSISTSHKTLCNERMAISKDNDQLSWKENFRNVFSSTPSKYNKENGT